MLLIIAVQAIIVCQQLQVFEVDVGRGGATRSRSLVKILLLL
jgi:hypothetical protein